MMNNNSYELDALRRKEMIQRAENRRRATALRETAKPEQHRNVVSPTLAQVGRTLSNIGNNLQERFGDLPENAVGTSYQPETA